ncbi:MAG: hypothetical protein QOK42_1678 [Frankiaceae bacterium]|nr:hypothetical protein [Frankiaceae bacterium]
MRLRFTALRCLPVSLLAAAALVSLPPPAEASGVPHVLTSGAVGSARQVVLVSSSSTSATTATVYWWIKHIDGSWHLARNGVAARIGVNGMSSGKREGDGKTPMGVYPVGTGFGWYANPGTKLPWRVADSNSRWVDDSGSAYYNQWMQAPANGRWHSAEQLRVTPYTYAIQVGYNLSHKPGMGSAIFMHLNTGRATSGCITSDKMTIVSSLKWLNPALQPHFVIGTRDWIATH